MIANPRRRAATVLRLLRKTYPEADCTLRHADPYELLVATILSAQCTDERVNQVTPDLFRRYPDVAAMAQAQPKALEEAIYTTGFFRSKARSILGTCRRIVDEHGGHVPRTMEALTALPGVGRKTANVVLGNAFGIVEGIVIDTHCGRLARRLGWSLQKDPVKVERDVCALLPRTSWVFVSHALILHGRRVCLSRRARCDECPLARHCPSAGHAT